MGVRLNILANPAFRLRLDAPQSAGAGTPPANVRAFPAQDSGVIPGNNRVAAAPRAGAAALQPNPVGLNLAGERTPAAEPAAPRATEAEMDRPEQENAAPARRLRDFRFLTAAESARERDLEARLDRLERELESAANRFRSSDSFSIRIDAQLDRARLERDLEQIQSEIGRLRLNRVFGGAVAGIGAPENAQPTSEIAPAGAHAGASDRVPGLNLLA